MKNPPITVEMVLETGFHHAAYWDLQQADFSAEVRNMCAENLCGKYGTSWVCPPGCGQLEEVAQWIRGFDYGILVQVTGQLEDSFDYATMEKTEKTCSQLMEELEKKVGKSVANFRILKTGVCTKCETCTYPHAPCRFPERLSPSLEACGIWVSEECKKAGLEYYYGTKTMAFTGAVLVKE